MKMYYNCKWMTFLFILAILYEITSEKKSFLRVYRHNKSNFSSFFGENNRTYSILNQSMTSLRLLSSDKLRVQRDIHSKTNRNDEKEQSAVKNNKMASKLLKLEEKHTKESIKNIRETNKDKLQVSSSDKNELDSIYKYLKSLLNIEEPNDKKKLKFGQRFIPKEKSNVEEENKSTTKQIAKENVLMKQNYTQQSHLLDLNSFHYLNNMASKKDRKSIKVQKIVLTKSKKGLIKDKSDRNKSSGNVIFFGILVNGDNRTKKNFEHKIHMVGESHVERKMKDPKNKASLPENSENSIKNSDKSSKLLPISYDNRLLNKYLMKERKHLQTKARQNDAIRKTIRERHHTKSRKANYKNFKKHIRIASKNFKQKRENETLSKFKTRHHYPLYIGHSSLIEQVKAATPVKMMLLFTVLCISIVVITVLFNCPLIYKALTEGSYDGDSSAKQALISINERKSRKRFLSSKTRHRNVKDFHSNVKKFPKSESDTEPDVLENESNTSESSSQILKTKLLLNNVKEMPNSNEENIKVDKQNIKISSSNQKETLKITKMAMAQEQEFGEDIETKSTELKKVKNTVELFTPLASKTNKNTENNVILEQENILDEKVVETVGKSETECESESGKCNQYLSELCSVLDVANKQLGNELVYLTDDNNCETKVQKKMNFFNNSNVWKYEPHLLKYHFIDNEQTNDDTTTTDGEQVNMRANITKQEDWSKKPITNPKIEITKLNQMREVFQNSVDSPTSNKTIRNTAVSKNILKPRSLIDVLKEFQVDGSSSDSLMIDSE
ncbi:putative leucine-rich repeat-containing protein DDB_G0290503 [Centruroides vittatus]|uniref:putative leucine-rich repeat-containing protein DDB_G0290503 n=1 Tax=Centruroides vittatus TaxID=120091 RepID=UPI0035105606